MSEVHSREEEPAGNEVAGDYTLLFGTDGTLDDAHSLLEWALGATSFTVSDRDDESFIVCLRPSAADIVDLNDATLVVRLNDMADLADERLPLGSFAFELGFARALRTRAELHCVRLLARKVKSVTPSLLLRDGYVIVHGGRSE